MTNLHWRRPGPISIWVLEKVGWAHKQNITPDFRTLGAHQRRFDSFSQSASPGDSSNLEVWRHHFKQQLPKKRVPPAGKFGQRGRRQWPSAPSRYATKFNLVMLSFHFDIVLQSSTWLCPGISVGSDIVIRSSRLLLFAFSSPGKWNIFLPTLITGFSFNLMSAMHDIGLAEKNCVFSTVCF